MCASNNWGQEVNNSACVIRCWKVDWKPSFYRSVRVGVLMELTPQEGLVCHGN